MIPTWMTDEVPTHRGSAWWSCEPDGYVFNCFGTDSCVRYLQKNWYMATTKVPLTDFFQNWPHRTEAEDALFEIETGGESIMQTLKRITLNA